MSEFIEKMLGSRQMEYREGDIEILGLRDVLLPAYTYRRFVEELYGEKGDEAFDIIFDIGESHAELGIEEIGRVHKIPKREFFDQMMDSANALGLGKMEIEYFVPEKSKMMVTITGSPFKDEFNNSDILQDLDRPIDQLQAGMLHGFASAVLDGEVETVEEKCSFLGDPHCELKVAPVSED